MLTEDWKKLAKQAENIHKNSAALTLKLFPFDDESTLETYNSLPTAIGTSVTDFGNPAPFPIEVYNEKLPESTKEITEKDPIELLADLRAKKYTAYEVLKAYYHASLFAAKLTNCVYEFLPEESLAAAKELDSNHDSSKDKMLFGLPISLKEMIPFKGRSVTHGSLCFLDRVVDYNADLVNIILKEGGIPFVRTTNPQSLMMLECESFTHGRTVNPYNSNLTCGGSSGGEGAINGIHASTLGFGSDIGGSIRAPAAFNGIYGLRTTLGRLPTADFFSFQMGSESIFSVTGPLSRSLDLVELSMKTIIGSKPWLIDPSLTSLEWKPSTQKKFRIGIMLDDGIVTPQPPIIRALNLVKEKLSKLENVELITFSPYQHERLFEFLAKLYYEDGGKDTRGGCEATGEPICDQTSWAIDGNKEELPIKDLWKYNLQKQKFRKDYLKHWMSYTNDSGEILDAVFAPVFAGTAPKHRTAKYWGYTAVWNVLDYPVLVTPVTKVDPKLDLPLKDYTPKNDLDKQVYEEYDDPKSFENAPVGLGIVGMRNTEEKLIEIGKIFRDVL